MSLFSSADGFHNTIINHNKGFICGQQKDLGSRDILELLLTSAPSLSKRRAELAVLSWVGEQLLAGSDGLLTAQIYWEIHE